MGNQNMLQIKTNSQNMSLKKTWEKDNLRFQGRALFSSVNV